MADNTEDQQYSIEQDGIINLLKLNDIGPINTDAINSSAWLKLAGAIPEFKRKLMRDQMFVVYSKE